MEKQTEEKTCKKCLHYEYCLNRFRKAKKDGQYKLLDEEEYFAHADDCDMFITGYRKASDVARKIFAEIEAIIEVDKYGEAKLDVRELYKLQKKYESEGEG